MSMIFDLSDDDYKQKVYDEINKLEKYARKPTQRMFYYPRLTPQEVLFEEQEYILNNSYNGKHIYEWNSDGYTKRQIYTVVHRMIMYSTICKANSNGDRNIAKMIIAGTAGTTPGQNVVYSLVINIIEHFFGRWSDNSENIRTMLQHLRCKTLISFRWYKDVFLSRVMELPECNNTHWKSKFIVGLPSLFAERVRKALTKGETSINYDEYTYDKLIGTCIQKGSSLCNEIKLNQTRRFRFDSDTSESSTSNEDLTVLENESYISSDSDEERARVLM
ncbi:uncharacterized protein LOC132062056 [Lycium ferocissimum]|uniref:uncharacterized protein LOC132062056 n=1 Tax=Lycium ferocissimum TaxID=112874 RepID=UPI0028165DF5|nr:uncharacterized protein LOC132062056 [Lycium ferocissimum]